MKNIKGKNVMVTGGAGFIGSHLVKRLINEGAHVSIAVKYKSVFDCIRLVSIWDKVNVIEVDLRNIDSLSQFRNKKYDLLFHLAAYNHVGDSFIHYQEALVSNLLGTANLLENGPDFDRFIYTATSEVYGYQESVPFKEGNIPFPISPYAIGKYAGELYARMKAFQSQKNNIVCIRPFNTFGPFQSERAIIPELIMKCLNGIKIETTEGKQTREFNYVDNIVDGFLLAATIDEVYDEPINIGAGEEIAIIDLIHKIHDLCESESDLKIGALAYRPTEIWRMKADNQNALKYLKWNPNVSFNDGLISTVNWFRKFYDVYFKGELRSL